MQHPLEPGTELFKRKIGEKSEAAEVDAHDGDGAALEPPRRGQQGSIAAEHENAIGLKVRPIGGNFLIEERAPDDQLALAFLLKLTEDSAAALKGVLRDRAAGGDLVFCLGSSELVATELSLAGPGWAKIFLDARAQTIDGLVAAMHQERARIDAPAVDMTFSTWNSGAYS